MEAFLRACVLESAKNKELVAQFDRLTGYNLSMRGSDIELKVDKSTGRLEEGVQDFVQFVYEYVFLPLIAKEKQPRN